jgi:hypothetical protein
MDREPTRAFGKAPAQPPDHEGAGRADQGHPAPAGHSEWLFRYQEPAEQSDDRDYTELDKLIKGKYLAASSRRDQFGQIRVDGDLLQTNADSRDKTPGVHTDRRVLCRHDCGRNGVPDQRSDEDGSPAQPVRNRSEPDAADEHACEIAKDEKADAFDGKKPGRGVGEETAPHQAGGDVAAQEYVIELKDAAQRDQQHQSPDGAR